jgi:hypothetical protein
MLVLQDYLQWRCAPTLIFEILEEVHAGMYEGILYLHAYLRSCVRYPSWHGSQSQIL